MIVFLISESMKENPYEDVDLKGRGLFRKSVLLPERSDESLNTTWRNKAATPQVSNRDQPPSVMSFITLIQLLAINTYRPLY